MQPTDKCLLDLTASDLMSRDVVRLPEEMPLHGAVLLLLQNQIGWAPVVDAQGRCVGAFSTTDFLRLVLTQSQANTPPTVALPVACSFQIKRGDSDHEEGTLCTQSFGVCPIQTKKSGSNGEGVVACGHPNCVLADWQVVDVTQLPADEVRRFMTADPVTVTAEESICHLARMMIDAHIHRVIVVNEQRVPIGVVSSTDVMAAVAYPVIKV
jgi:CBS domain-containing protein